MPSRLPEAQHQIQLGPRTITYSLRRSSRRSIGLLSDYQLEDKAEAAALWYVVGREPAYEKLVLDKLFKKI